MLVGRVHVRARANQPLCRFHVVPMCRPVKRRCAVALRCVYVDSFLQQDARSVTILFLHRLDEPKV